MHHGLKYLVQWKDGIYQNCKLSDTRYSDAFITMRAIFPANWKQVLFWKCRNISKDRR